MRGKDNFDTPIKELAECLGVGTDKDSSEKLNASYYVTWEKVSGWEGKKAGKKVRLIGVRLDTGGHLETVAGQTYHDRIAKKDFANYLWNVIGAVRFGKNLNSAAPTFTPAEDLLLPDESVAAFLGKKSKIRPCPCCGSIAVLHGRRVRQHGNVVLTISCMKGAFQCGIQTSTCVKDNPEKIDEGKQDLISRWNKRPVKK